MGMQILALNISKNTNNIIIFQRPAKRWGPARNMS